MESSWKQFEHLAGTAKLSESLGHSYLVSMKGNCTRLYRRITGSQPTFRANDEYLPPRLRTKPEPSDFVSRECLTGRVPVTRYWGRERNYELNGHRPAGIPVWLGYFDWVVGFEYGWADPSVPPRTVFCEPNYADRLTDFFNEASPLGQADEHSLVVFGGSDAPLSAISGRCLRNIRSHFKDVYFEAYDEKRRGVRVMPIGLLEHYVRSNPDLVLQLALTLSREPNTTQDPRSVLAAWGAWWPGLDELIPDRRHARAFASSRDFVSHVSLSSDEWFEALTVFDYVMCPLGNGVQAPKLVEAVLMGSIPIVTEHPALRELEHRGFPLLMVQQWNQLTPDLLWNEYNRLFDRVSDFRLKLLDLNEWWKFSFPGQPQEPLPQWLVA